MFQLVHHPATLEPPVADGAAARHPRWNFVRHFFEMCMAMCLGWAVLGLPYFGLAHLAGYPDPVHQLPELSTLVAAFIMSVPMVAWMRYRGHSWQCAWEMSGAMFFEAILLIGLAWVGLVPSVDLFVWFHGLMPVAMIAAMVYRLDLYTSPPSRPRH